MTGAKIPRRLLGVTCLLLPAAREACVCCCPVVYHSLVFPAASSPSIKMRISLFPKRNLPVYRDVIEHMSSWKKDAGVSAMFGRRCGCSAARPGGTHQTSCSMIRPWCKDERGEGGGVKRSSSGCQERKCLLLKGEAKS